MEGGGFALSTSRVTLRTGGVSVMFTVPDIVGFRRSFSCVQLHKWVFALNKRLGGGHITVCTRAV